MPNGKHWTNEKWEAYAGPLDVLNSQLEKFAFVQKYELLKNYHGNPCRYLCWDGKDSNGRKMERIVVIQLASESKPATYSIWYGASQLREKEEIYSSHEYLIKELTVPLNPNEVMKLIEQACDLANKIRKKDLKRVYTVLDVPKT